MEAASRREQIEGRGKRSPKIRRSQGEEGEKTESGRDR